MANAARLPMKRTWAGHSVTGILSASRSAAATWKSPGFRCGWFAYAGVFEPWRAALPMWRIKFLSPTIW